MSVKPLLAALCAATALSLPLSALAQDITIGVSIATTGPAAALGGPQKLTLGLWPEEIAGHKVKIVQLDDAGDPSAATTNARRLASENNVDVLIGSSTTPPSMAVGAVAAESGIPHFALAPAVFTGNSARWSFVIPQPVTLMADQIFTHMQKAGIKTVGMIGFSDSWGDLWVKAFKDSAEAKGLSLVADLRYARSDTSVAGQVLKIVAAKPDTVLIAASGTGAALPQTALKERNYGGKVYQTHGAASLDFLRIAGASAEGVVMPTGPVLVAELQPDSALTKKPGLDFVTAYEAKNGKDSRNLFGAYIYDVAKVLERAVPVALKTAKPGSAEFRDALRTAIETEKDIGGTHGVYNYTAKDRNGVDTRAAILITVKGGKWALVQ